MSIKLKQRVVFLDWTRKKTATQVSAVIREIDLTDQQKEKILEMLGPIVKKTTEIRIEIEIEQQE